MKINFKSIISFILVFLVANLLLINANVTKANDIPETLIPETLTFEKNETSKTETIGEFENKSARVETAQGTLQSRLMDLKNQYPTLSYSIADFEDLFDGDAGKAAIITDVVPDPEQSEIRDVSGVETKVFTNLIIFYDEVTYVNEVPEQITEVNVTITAPKVGDVATEKTTATVTIDDNSHATIVSDEPPFYIVGYPEAPGKVEQFTGTFEEGKDYFVEAYIIPKSGYAFSNDVKLLVNGGTEYQLSEWNGPRQLLIYAKIKATNGEAATGAESTEKYKVLEGDKQTTTVNDGVSIRFDIEFAKFKESGKVFVDGKELDSTKYTAKEGSTIITLAKDYAKTLSLGEHSLKVAVADGEATATFTIAKSTSNPKTGDEVEMLAGISILAVVGLIATINLRKRF